MTAYMVQGDLDYSPAMQRAVSAALDAGAGVVYLPRLNKLLPTTATAINTSTLVVPNAVLSGAIPGMGVSSGSFIPAGTTIQTVGTSSIVISQNVVGTLLAGSTLTVNGAPLIYTVATPVYLNARDPMTVVTSGSVAAGATSLTLGSPLTTTGSMIVTGNGISTSPYIHSGAWTGSYTTIPQYTNVSSITLSQATWGPVASGTTLTLLYPVTSPVLRILGDGIGETLISSQFYQSGTAQTGITALYAPPFSSSGNIRTAFEISDLSIVNSASVAAMTGINIAGNPAAASAEITDVFIHDMSIIYTPGTNSANFVGIVIADSQGNYLDGIDIENAGTGIALNNAGDSALSNILVGNGKGGPGIDVLGKAYHGNTSASLHVGEGVFLTNVQTNGQAIGLRIRDQTWGTAAGCSFTTCGTLALLATNSNAQGYVTGWSFTGCEFQGSAANVTSTGTVAYAQSTITVTGTLPSSVAAGNLISGWGIIQATTIQSVGTNWITISNPIVYQSGTVVPSYVISQANAVSLDACVTAFQFLGCFITLSSYGITAGGGEHAINGCTFLSNAGGHVYFNGAQASTIVGNSFSQGGTAITLSNSYANTISANTFSNNSGDIVLTGSNSKRNNTSGNVLFSFGWLQASYAELPPPMPPSPSTQADYNFMQGNIYYYIPYLGPNSVVQNCMTY
ncbi:MAG: right-handed parallel beta-helix repeat-containing protein [Alphaproteobacteria bacterium]|nr:right-handed parallel beta-helix repeat-containing protein [Alphaproteobacteria bacterium]